MPSEYFEGIVGIYQAEIPARGTKVLVYLNTASTRYFYSKFKCLVIRTYFTNIINIIMMLQTTNLTWRHTKQLEWHWHLEIRETNNKHLWNNCNITYIKIKFVRHYFSLFQIFLNWGCFYKHLAATPSTCKYGCRDKWVNFLLQEQ